MGKESEKEPFLPFSQQETPEPGVIEISADDIENEDCNVCGDSGVSCQYCGGGQKAYEAEKARKKQNKR